MSLDDVILDEKKNGFCEFDGYFDNINNVEIIKNDFLGYLLKSQESNNLVFAKYLDVFDSTVEISIDNIDSYNDVLETYKYFIENQFKLIEYLKLDFWEILLDHLECFYEIELDIYENKNENLKRILSDYEYENRKKEAKEYLDLYKRANDTNEKNNKCDKLKILDEVLKIRAIEINRVNEYDTIDSKYGEIWFYFSYTLDEEHGAELILRNGGLNDENFS